MIAKLTHLFKELGVDPTAEEIADMLYLAKYIIPEQPDQKDKEPPIKASPSDSDNQSRNKTKDTEKEPEKEEVPIYSADTELDDTVGPEKVDIPFRVPAVTALHNQIAIERALRPLMRKIPSRNRFTLDESETVRQIAEMDNWNVVLKPEAARWLDAFIVVEESTSMNMWFQTIHELKILLERHGAFRDIQQWGFHIDTKTNNIHLHSGGYDKTQQTSRNPRELIHPSGNRLIIVISDCVSSAWYNGKMSEMMGQWTSHGIVIILQMLPYWFWERTGLSQAEILYMRAISPGMVNEKLVIDSFDMGSTISNISKFKFPVITIDSDSIGSWAKNISGKGGEWIPGIIMPPKNDNTDNHSDMNNTQNIDMTVEKRINLFKATASPTAKKLAAYFAAVPLNLHIMHLVQKVMLPNSNQVHFAEVFLSGLIKQQFTGELNIHPYEIKYDFIKGAREQLISKSLVSETIQAISIFIEKYLGKPFDFNALLKNPSTVETLFKDKDMYSFANISFQVLKQLGGRYAKLADRIRHININSETYKSMSIERNYAQVPEDKVRIVYPIDFPERMDIEIPFKLLVLGDFTLTNDERFIEDREKTVINRENFNKVLDSMKICLRIQCPNRLSSRSFDENLNFEIKFTSLTDFSPDSLVKNIPELNEMIEKRSTLQVLKKYLVTNKLFRKIIRDFLKNIDREVLRKQEFEKQLKEIVQKGNIQNEKEFTQINSGLYVFVNEILKRNEEINQINFSIIDDIITKQDKKLSSQMDDILHHPEFQKLESAWRALKFLVDRTDFSENIQIEILNVSKSDLLEDFEDSPRIEDTVLYQTIYSEIYKTPGEYPYGTIIGNYQFSQRPKDINLLKKIANTAARVDAPFIASVSPEMFDLNSFTDLNSLSLKNFIERNEYYEWQSLRDSDYARYVGLTLPNFLLRLPYGDETESVKTFRYEENVIENHNHYLWGNSAFAFASRLTDSFANHRLCVNIIGPQRGGTVYDLPIHHFRGNNTFNGKLPTEVSITDRLEYELSDEGFIPLCIHKNENFASFFSANSVQKVKYFSDTVDGKEAEFNYKISRQLPYLFFISRFAHYIKVLQREVIGSSKEKEGLERELTDWIRQFITDAEYVSPVILSRKPLRQARIQIDEIEGDNSAYQMNLIIQPRLKYLGKHFTLSLTTKLDNR